MRIKFLAQGIYGCPLTGTALIPDLWSFHYRSKVITTRPESLSENRKKNFVLFLILWHLFPFQSVKFNTFHSYHSQLPPPPLWQYAKFKVLQSVIQCRSFLEISYIGDANSKFSVCLLHGCLGDVAVFVGLWNSLFISQYECKWSSETTFYSVFV